MARESVAGPQLFQSCFSQVGGVKLTEDGKGVGMGVDVATGSTVSVGRGEGVGQGVVGAPARPVDGAGKVSPGRNQPRTMPPAASNRHSSRSLTGGT